MKNERILHVERNWIIRKGFQGLMETFGSEDQQKIIASVSSLGEVEDLFKGGINPTVVVVGDRFSDITSGKEMADRIKTFFPEVKIVSLGVDDVDWGDINIPFVCSAEQIAKYVRELQH